MTLEQITARIIELESSVLTKQTEIARLVTEAKAHFQSDPEWIEWAKQSLQIERRRCYEYYAITKLLQDPELVRRAALKQTVESLAFRKLAVIAGLGIEQIETLAGANDLADCSRDDLRDLVAKLLGRTRPDTPAADRINLPPPEQLLLAFDNEAGYRKMPSETAFTYSINFMHLAVSAARHNRHREFIEAAIPALEDSLQQLREILDQKGGVQP